MSELMLSAFRALALPPPEPALMINPVPSSAPRMVTLAVPPERIACRRAAAQASITAFRLSPSGDRLPCTILGTPIARMIIIRPITTINSISVKAEPSAKPKFGRRSFITGRCCW